MEEVVEKLATLRQGLQVKTIIIDNHILYIAGRGLFIHLNEKIL